MEEDTQNELYFSTLVTKSLEPVNSDERYFEGLLTVEMKDKQGEVTIVDELYKVLPIWMDRGAPISDTHSNRIIGKGINFSKTIYKDKDGEEIPAIKITGKIFKDYELDHDIWSKIKSGEYKGLSFGGATRANRTPIKMKDGSVAYALRELEHYEVAVCKDPAVPMALITDFNPLAKALTDNSERRGDKLVIKCTKFGCYVNKVNLSEEDTFEGKVRKLQADGKSRESAEKIVGSFVKANPEWGEQHGMTSADEDLIDSETSDPANPNKRKGKHGKKWDEEETAKIKIQRVLEEEERKEKETGKKIYDVDIRELEANKAHSKPYTDKFGKRHVSWTCPECGEEFGIAGHGGEGETFEHTMSHERDRKNVQEKSVKKIVDELNKITKLTEGGREVMLEAKEIIDRDQRGKENEMYKAQFKELEQENGTDHSNSEGDKHQMYNQNAGKESWVGNGSPYPKIVKTEELPNSKDEQDDISDEHASHNTPTEDGRLGSKSKKSNVNKIIPLIAGVGARLASVASSLLESNEDEETTKAISGGSYGGAVRHASKETVQGSGDSAQVTEVKEEEEDIKKNEYIDKVNPVTEAYFNARTGQKPKGGMKPFCPNCGRSHIVEDDQQIEAYKKINPNKEPTLMSFGRTCPNCGHAGKKKDNDTKNDNKHKSIKLDGIILLNKMKNI